MAHNRRNTVRVTREQQRRAGFGSARSFSNALTKAENRRSSSGGGSSTADLVKEILARGAPQTPSVPSPTPRPSPVVSTPPRAPVSFASAPTVGSPFSTSDLRTAQSTPDTLDKQRQQAQAIQSQQGGGFFSRFGRGLSALGGNIFGNIARGARDIAGGIVSGVSNAAQEGFRPSGFSNLAQSPIGQAARNSGSATAINTGIPIFSLTNSNPLTNTDTANRQQTVSLPQNEPTQVGGRTGTQTSTIEPAAPSRGSFSPPAPPTPEITPEERQANVARAQQLEAIRQNQIAGLQQQYDQTFALLQQKLAEPQTSETQQFVNQLESEITGLESEIAELKVPSQEQLDLERQDQEFQAREAAIQAGFNKSAAAISEQPVPYGFITGQTAAVERRANADLQTIAAQRLPLQQRIANEQAKRQAALDIVTTRLEGLRGRSQRAQTLADRERQRQQQLEDERRRAAAEAAKPVTLPQGAGLFNRTTGERLAYNPETYAPSQSNQRLYTGTTIPPDIRSLVVADITENNATLAQLIGAYPEVDSTYLESLVDALTGGSGGFDFSTL